MSMPEEGQKSRQPYCLTQVHYAGVGSTSSWAALVGICELGNLEIPSNRIGSGEAFELRLGVQQVASRGRPIR